MRGGALRIGTIRGIPVKAHWSFLLVLPLLATLFAENFVAAAELAGVTPTGVTWAPWLWGLFVAVGLFASVLLHELAHSLYALRVGLRVRGITLLMVGGISEIVDPPRQPGQEAMMALVGPLTSLVLGAVLGGAGLLLGDRAPSDLVFALLLLGQLNLVLGVFNLVPAFPMDGGRILRAALTPALGPLRATRAAATVGKTFAVAFAVTGLVTGGFLLVLVAFFVWMGANAEGAQVALRETLGDQPVRDVVGPPVPGVHPVATLDEAVALMRASRRLSLPVLDGDEVRGVLALEAIQGVPPERWSTTLVRDVAKRVAPLAPSDDAWSALSRMSEEQVAEIPVVENGVYVGLLSQADILRGVRLRELEGGGARRGRPLRRSPV